MSGIAYDPERFRVWANDVVKYLNGDGDSIGYCSRKFSEQMETLVQPDVWTGDAASKNYHNFLETHQALVTFVNSFGEAFEQGMNEINKIVNNLEVANLGVNTNVASTFGTLSYDQMSTLSEENVKTDTVKYNYTAISSIGKALDQIYGNLESINTNLTTKLNELNDGSGMFDCNTAQGVKESLTNTLNTNMQKILECLNICIENISAAAEAASAIGS